MKLNTIYFTAVLFLSGFVIAGCCNCGAGENNIVKGYITVVGNEPFAKLAIMFENKKAFILECNEELKNELWKKQGSYYAVRYKDSRIEEGLPVLLVEEATPINENNNNNIEN